MHKRRFKQFVIGALACVSLACAASAFALAPHAVFAETLTVDSAQDWAELLSSDEVRLESDLVVTYPLEGFDGVFDGQGHTIRCEGAAFASLSGRVQNVKFEGDTAIDGGDGVILNCVARGGLAVGFEGQIVASYAGKKLEGDTSYCVAPAFSDAGEGDTVRYHNAFNAKEVAELLERSRIAASCAYGYNFAELNAHLPGLSFGEKGYVFAGLGEEWEPYRISSAWEMAYLSAYVNGGEDFEGVSFLQMCDIDFASFGTLCPIGRSDTERGFCGVYDGNGYALFNLNIDTSFGSVDNALFGRLGGFVYNLGIESGKIAGGSCASFAAVGMAGREPLIANCYSRATIAGEWRSGGIADNYNGAIENCWAYHFNRYPLVSYAAARIENCYSNGQIVSGTAEVVDCKTVSRGELNGEDCVEALSDYSLRLAMKRGGGALAWTRGALFPELTRTKGTFEGSGTRSDPYLLSSVRDWIYLSLNVNAGESYEDKYFAATADVDFSSLDSFFAIGSFDSGNAFAGTLDGCGYALKHLRITETAIGEIDNNALFGTLAGTVVNLGIEGGEIRGGCVAGIAVGGTAESRIVNCFVRDVTFVAGTRAGGIADNFAGKISGCYYEGKEPLVSYAATSVTYSASETVTLGTVTYESGNVSSQAESDAFRNGRVLYSALRISFDPSLVRYWSGGRPCLDAHSLAGSGSKSDPYCVSSASDLVFFAASVNSGTPYKDRWVLQTADIDMQSVFFMPIGLADTENRFYGVYDGGGHTISNLTVHSNELTVKNALFGSLFGSVLNVGIESGRIYGDYAAGIASEGYHLKTRILNSYSKAEVYGTVRSGGFVDDFGGDIFNCWYDNAQKLPFCSFRGGLIYHCFTVGDVMAKNAASVGEISDCIENTDFAAHAEAERFDRQFNESSLTGSMEYGYSRSDMVLWELGEDGIRFSGERFVLNAENISTYRDLIIECYLWNFVGIAAIVLAIVGIVISFLTEGKRFAGKKHERKHR